MNRDHMLKAVLQKLKQKITDCGRFLKVMYIFIK